MFKINSYLVQLNFRVFIFILYSFSLLQFQLQIIKTIDLSTVQIYARMLRVDCNFVILMHIILDSEHKNRMHKDAEQTDSIEPHV